MLTISLLITISGFQPLEAYFHLPGAMPQAFTFRAVGASESVFSLLGLVILTFEAKHYASVRMNAASIKRWYLYKMRPKGQPRDSSTPR
jgi:hypothetical protein